MPIQRTYFDILTDTGGDFVDTGPHVCGILMGLACDTGAFDTGTVFDLTGSISGVKYANIAGQGTSAWQACPRWLAYDTGGAVVGDQSPPVDEPLRLTVTQGDSDTGQKSAKFWAWVVS